MILAASAVLGFATDPALRDGVDRHPRRGLRGAARRHPHLGSRRQRVDVRVHRRRDRATCARGSHARTVEAPRDTLHLDHAATTPVAPPGARGDAAVPDHNAGESVVGARNRARRASSRRRVRAIGLPAVLELRPAARSSSPARGPRPTTSRCAASSSAGAASGDGTSSSAPSSTRRCSRRRGASRRPARPRSPSSDATATACVAPGRGGGGGDSGDRACFSHARQ